MRPLAFQFYFFFFLVFSLLSSSRRLHRLSANFTARAFIRVVMLTVFVMKLANCSDRILTCRIKSIRSPAKVGLVVTDLITSPVVSWEGWETPPPQHRGSAVILCSTTGVVRPLCSCGDLLLSSARLVYVLVDVDWNTFSCG